MILNAKQYKELQDIDGWRHPERNRRRDDANGGVAFQVLQSQEEERKRLSRELHDDIGQRLSLAASTVALLASQSRRGKLAKRLSDLREDLDHLCSDVHTMSHNLHSHQLDHLGLRSALKDLGVRMCQPGIQVDIDVADLCEPRSKEVSLCIYRVAQEALNNAVKHSHASSIVLIATTINEGVYMAIQDSGDGFDTRMRAPGLGLISMQERLRLVNGKLEYQSVLGHGTEVWVFVPNMTDVDRSASLGRRVQSDISTLSVA